MIIQQVKKILNPESRLYKRLSNIYYWWRPRVRDLDVVLERYNRYKKENEQGIKFMQIGSNDGLTNDLIRNLVIENDWEGVVIEPVRFVFDKLPLNYREAKGRIFFENIAISDKQGSQVFYEIREQKDISGLPSWYDQLSSFNKEIILKHKSVIPNIEEMISEVMIQTDTVENVLQKYGIQKVDVIHMDTEGYDAQIIAGINFSRIKPDIILFENRHLSQDDFRKTCKKLIKNGYVNFYNYTDTLAIQSSLAGKLRA